MFGFVPFSIIRAFYACTLARVNFASFTLPIVEAMINDSHRKPVSQPRTRTRLEGWIGKFARSLSMRCLYSFIG